MKRILMRTVKDQESERQEGEGPLRVGIVPGARGAGATLVSLALAQMISQRKRKGRDRVTYLELRNHGGGPAVYDWTGMEKRFAGREFHDFFRMAEHNEPFRQKLNLDEGINWILPLEDLPEGDGRRTERLLRRLPGNVLLCDFSFSGRISGQLREHLGDMDALILVVEPSPAGLLASLDALREGRRMEMAGMPVIRVVNRWNDGVEKREVLKFLEDRALIRIPVIPYEYLCRCQFGCRLPLSDPEIGRRLGPPLEKIIDRLFP